VGQPARCSHFGLSYATAILISPRLEPDTAAALRKMYFALSGAAPLNKWLQPKSPEAKLLDGLIDPQPFPGWMSEADLGIYADGFGVGGFRGPLNRYRAQALDFGELAELSGRTIVQPSAFIAGERDPVRAFIPGLDLYVSPGIACANFRGSTIVPGIGHWVQQEAPRQSNEAPKALVLRFCHLAGCLRAGV
jgi:pimeloyl-ACP methyl ester carboxylesterase